MQKRGKSANDFSNFAGTFSKAFTFWQLLAARRAYHRPRGPGSAAARRRSMATRAILRRLEPMAPQGHRITRRQTKGTCSKLSRLSPMAPGGTQRQRVGPAVPRQKLHRPRRGSMTPQFWGVRALCFSAGLSEPSLLRRPPLACPAAVKPE